MLDKRDTIMNRFANSLIEVGAIAMLAGGFSTLPAVSLAAPPPELAANTPAELRAKAEYCAKVAVDYRARMRLDEKHAIQFFTLANSWDQKAARYRAAALNAAATPLPSS
jgi:hypothetical protein